jgi:rhodanese-related sulfurtransferase
VAENSSAGLVQRLKQKGFTNAFALKGGLAAWKNANYPMGGSAK